MIALKIHSEPEFQRCGEIRETREKFSGLNTVKNFLFVDREVEEHRGSRDPSETVGN